MEDRHLLACPMEASCPPAHLMAVFDGHRGSEAAQYAVDNLECRLRDTWGDSSAEAALEVRCRHSSEVTSQRLATVVIAASVDLKYSPIDICAAYILSCTCPLAR